jgi:hypothetical protein
MAAILILSGNLESKTVIDAIWANNLQYGPIEEFHLVHSPESFAKPGCRASEIRERLIGEQFVTYPIRGVDHQPEGKQESESDYAARVVREVVQAQPVRQVDVIVDLSGARRPQSHALYAAANVCAISKIHMVDVIDYDLCKQHFLRDLELNKHYRLVVFPPSKKVRELARECCVEHRDYRSEIRRLSDSLEQRPDSNTYGELRTHLLDAIEQLEQRRYRLALQALGCATEAALREFYRQFCELELDPKRTYQEGLTLHDLWHRIHGLYQRLPDDVVVNSEQALSLWKPKPFVEAMIALVPFRNIASHARDIKKPRRRLSQQEVFYALYLLSAMLDTWLEVSKLGTEGRT